MNAIPADMVTHNGMATYTHRYEAPNVVSCSLGLIDKPYALVISPKTHLVLYRKRPEDSCSFFNCSSPLKSRLSAEKAFATTDDANRIVDLKPRASLEMQHAMLSKQDGN